MYFANFQEQCALLFPFSTSENSAIVDFEAYFIRVELLSM